MLEPEQVDEILGQLRETVKTELKKEQRLWDIGDIADYFKVGKSTASRYRKQPDFPQSIAVPYDVNGAQRVTQRWVPAEVKRWGLRQRAA